MKPETGVSCRCFCRRPLLILFFAIFNYINLTVAQSGSRAKEMATRRLLGSSRGGILFRLVVEAVSLTLVCFLLALLLANIVKPTAENLLQSPLDFSILLTPVGIVLSVGFVVLTGFLSGILPAVLISAAKPVEVVRGSFRRRSKMLFSKYFIGFQEVITIVLLSMSLVMVLQMRHMVHAPLGYHTENVLSLVNVNSEASINVLIDRLSVLPCVKRVGTSYGTPFSGGNNMSGTYGDRSLSVQWILMDTATFGMLGFEKLQDRGGAYDVHMDGSSFNLYLTEYTMQAMGLNPDAERFFSGNEALPISGVLADFHTRNILFPMQATVIGVAQEPFDAPWDVLIEVQGDLLKAYGEVEKELRKIALPGFELTFIDQAVQASFSEQKRMTQIVALFTCMAILISVLGLVAMSIYFIRQRAQEVAVRKVFGSSNRMVLNRLMLSFMTYVAVGFVVAFPVAWYLSVKWLSDYSYRIAFNPLYIVAAGIFCLAVSFVAVYFQSAARRTPIRSIV